MIRGSNESKLFSLNSNSCRLDLEIEMIVPTSYISLRDIISMSHSTSWKEDEISLKNHLLKRAALAYLQPMSKSSSYYDLGDNNSNKGLFENLICLYCGCFSWLRYNPLVGDFVEFLCNIQNKKK